MLDWVKELRLCVLMRKWLPDRVPGLEDDPKEGRDTVIRDELELWKYEGVLVNRMAIQGPKNHFGEWCPHKTVFCQERGGCDNCFISEGLQEAFLSRPQGVSSLGEREF